MLTKFDFCIKEYNKFIIMNLLFKCLKCEYDKIEKEKKGEKVDENIGELTKKVHSYSWNKEKTKFVFQEKKGKELKDVNLCEHFSSIKFNFKTRYGFFTLGWKIEIMNVEVVCASENPPKSIYFSDQTFSSSHHDYEEYKECCGNIIIYSAHEDGPHCDKEEALKLQERIAEQKKLMKELTEQHRKIQEETEEMEKEERQRQEKEEKKRRERENARRKLQEGENKELDEIIKRQEKENEELNNQIDIDISYIDVQMSQMITASYITYSSMINFNA